PAFSQAAPAPNQATPQQATPQQAPVQPAAPAGGLKTAALRDAIAASKSGASKKSVVTYAEFVAPSGDFYVPLGIMIPKSENVAADGIDTIFGQVEDSGGVVVTSFEEPVKATLFKGGLFADRSVALPSGKYTAVVGVAKAGTPVAVASKSIEVTSVGKDAPGTSKLLLTNDLVELSEPAPEKTGFAFGK